MSFLSQATPFYQQSLPSIIDSFYYNAEYQILCCKLCQQAIQPHFNLGTHLNRYHPKTYDRQSKAAILAAHEPELARCLAVKKRQTRSIDPHALRIPYLRYETDAYACLFCDQDDHQRLITLSCDQLRNHICAAYGGGTNRTSGITRARLSQCHGNLTFREYVGKTHIDELSRRVPCQTFFSYSRNRRWFEVNRPPHIMNDRQASRSSFSPSRTSYPNGNAAIFARLYHNKIAEMEKLSGIPHYTSVTVWGSKIHWPEYFRGYQLKNCALLLDPPTDGREEVLAIFHDSLDRNINAAREMVINDSHSQL